MGGGFDLMFWVEVTVWMVSILLVAVGLVGVFFPLLPGPVLIFLGAFTHKFFLPQYLSWWTIVFLGIGLVVCLVVDYVCMALGAKWLGASKWGMFGAGLGLTIGIFFGPLGLILGPVLGVVIAEIAIEKRHILPASYTGLAAGMGLVVAMILRLVVALLMTLLFIVDCIW